MTLVREPPIPAFLVVGTPRSGTTLVQRLASELPGVKVPPETDFFSRFYPAMFRWGFPLEGAALLEALTAYASTKNVRQAPVDVERIVERLGGCADGPLDLFAGVVRELAGDGAAIYGEKTPRHLRWWRPLSRVLPSLKVIAVVRDPRAVVDSWLRLPWGPKRTDGYLLLAERWCLVLRYEDVVAGPDEARVHIADLLGVTTAAGVPAPPAENLYLPRETWKSRATGTIATDRVRSWESSLPLRHADGIEAVCRRPMASFGYPTAMTLRQAMGERLRLAPGTSLALAREAARYRLETARIERVRLF
jgi:hypothetical protein